MYTCLYVHVYIHIHTHIYIYIYIYIHTHTYTCNLPPASPPPPATRVPGAPLSTPRRASGWISRYIHTIHSSYVLYICIYIYIYIFIYIHTYIYIYIYIYVCIYIYIYVYTHIYTHGLMMPVYVWMIAPHSTASGFPLLQKSTPNKSSTFEY